MRTTLNINDDLMVRAKIRAAERRTTLTAVIEDALREVLGEAEPAPREWDSGLPFPTWDGGGVPEGLNLSSNAATLEFLEGSPADGDA